MGVGKETGSIPSAATETLLRIAKPNSRLRRVGAPQAKIGFILTTILIPRKVVVD